MPKVVCDKCRMPFPEDDLLRDGELVCDYCNSRQYMEFFPAFLKEYEKGKKPEQLITNEHSSCFFHPDKVAAVACEGCGVYLCDLCDLYIDGRHLCPKCFKEGKDNISSFTNHVVLYDSIVLSVVVLSCLIPYIVIGTIPFVIVFSIMKWNKVNTPYKRRSKLRFSVAITIAMLQVIGIILLIVMIISP